jgi:hypothetical protein
VHIGSPTVTCQAFIDQSEGQSDTSEAFTVHLSEVVYGDTQAFCLNKCICPKGVFDEIHIAYMQYLCFYLLVAGVDVL